MAGTTLVGQAIGAQERADHDQAAGVAALDDVERVPGGKTFFWRGHYDHDMNVAHTDDTQLNVFAEFVPKLGAEACSSEMLFLGNIQLWIVQPPLPKAMRPSPVGR